MASELKSFVGRSCFVVDVVVVVGGGGFVVVVGCKNAGSSHYSCLSGRHC